MLTLIGTPIGNLQDISPRAIEALKEADIIACEDTRRARILLTHFGITGKRLLAHHSANEQKSAPGLVKLMQNGQTLAYISDGGMPTISDPGYCLVTATYDANLAVNVVGGITAEATAVAASGLPVSRRIFAGFLPKSGTAQTAYLESFFAQDLATALVFYEAPHRILKTLKNIEKLAPNAPCFVARELTKMHEEFYRGTVASVSAELALLPAIKGEITVVLAKV